LSERRVAHDLRVCPHPQEIFNTDVLPDSVAFFDEQCLLSLFPLDLLLYAVWHVHQSMSVCTLLVVKAGLSFLLSFLDDSLSIVVENLF
jgi:hypothetical protein